jgi:putative transposase
VPKENSHGERTIRGTTHRKRSFSKFGVRSRRCASGVSSAANQTWALDFIHDSLLNGRHFRAFAVLDQWSRESLAIEVDLSLTGERLTRVLERLHTTRGLTTTAYRLQFIEPGKPIQNAHIESFNARLRDECLVLVLLADARLKIEKWRIEYNRERPHSSFGNLTLEEFASQAANPESSAIARTARPAQELLAARGAQRDGLGSKT